MMAKDWIAGATANSHGQFRRKAQAAGMSTAAYARKEAGASGTLGKQARLAETLMGLRKKHKSAAKTMYPSANDSGE